MSTDDEISLPLDNKPELDDDGMNLFNVLCPNCSSIILCKNTAKFTPIQHNLPEYAKKTVLADVSVEFPTQSLNQFWCVHDMYKFQNVGFTNSVSKYRYLTCADCDLGPLGFHDNDDGPLKSYYIAFSRTIYGIPVPND